MKTPKHPGALNMESIFTPREAKEFSPLRALRAAADGSLPSTYEGGMLREYGESIGKPVTKNQFHLPFELMRRDLLAASSGASLVGTETPFALDVLRPYAATLRSGAQMMRFQGDATIPKVAAPSTATWLANETSAIAESQATIGQIAMSPKDAAVLTQVSSQLIRTSGGKMDAFLQRELLRTMGSALDAAIFAGTGADGQPQGIIVTDGVGAVSGTSIDWTDVTDMLWTVSEADGEQSVAWFGTPAVRRLLARRERISGGGRSIWDDNSIAGYPAIASRVAPTATLIVGAFSEVLIGMFQDSLEILVNPHSDFDRGLISYRAWMSCDIAVTAPGAFAVATSIT
jgi:HK97 family phage major capsid protein